jgi:hypothetical protein
MTLRFEIEGTERGVAIDALVIAGWAGRDRDAVAHHVAELEAIGVTPPSRTPLFYRGSASLVTQAERIEVVGAETSGEAEAVLVATDDGLMVGLGSDHTDRAAETLSVALSKQLCAKPMARALWRHAEVAAHWDRLVLRSWAEIDGAQVLYQEGTLAELLSDRDLLDAYGPLSRGTAMFCGTIPAMGGIRSAARFEMELADPVLGRSLRHGYEVEALPVVA